MTALRYAITHREETLKLTQELTNGKPDDPRAAYIYDDAVATHSVDPEIGLPMDKINWMVGELVADGTIAQPYDMTKHDRRHHPHRGPGQGGEIGRAESPLSFFSLSPRGEGSG